MLWDIVNFDKLFKILSKKIFLEISLQTSNYKRIVGFVHADRCMMYSIRLYRYTKYWGNTANERYAIVL